MRHGVALCIVALLIFATGPSLANDKDQPPVFNEASFAVIEIDAGPATFDAHVILDIWTNGSAVSFASIFQERTSVGTSIVLHSSGGRTGTEAKFGDLNTSATVRPHGKGGWISGVWPPPGKSRVLVVTAGTIVNWTFAVEPAHVEWRVIATGPTHAAMARDGDGAWLAAKAESFAAYATVGARHPIPVEHRLFGVFLSAPPIGAAHGAILAGPDGERECPCNLLGDSIHGPGEYEFRWTGAGVDRSQSPIIGWADVPGL